MVIELQLYDSLRQYIPSSSSGFLTVDVNDNITIGELLSELEVNEFEIGVIMVNEMKSQINRLLYDGDRVSLFAKGKKYWGDINGTNPL